MKKVKIFILISLLILLIIVTVILVTAGNTGIYNIDISEQSSGDSAIEIKYIGASGASISNFNSDEKIYKGEQLISLDTSEMLFNFGFKPKKPRVTRGLIQSR